MKTTTHKVKFLCSVVAMLGSACGTHDGDERANSTPAVQTQSSGPSEESISHFWFNYNGQPNPGRRVWMRVSGEIWAELYPNGMVSRYRLARRVEVNGQMGTVVRKVEGDARASWTANDGSFEVFIPDRGATTRILYFRHVTKEDPAPWRALAAITPVEEATE